MYEVLDLMPDRYKEWMHVYQEEAGQRYPSMSGPGALIHSEVRADLIDMGYSDIERLKITRIVKDIDKIMIEHSKQSRDNNSGQINIPKPPTQTGPPTAPNPPAKPKRPAES